MPWKKLDPGVGATPFRQNETPNLVRDVTGRGS